MKRELLFAVQTASADPLLKLGDNSPPSPDRDDGPGHRKNSLSPGRRPPIIRATLGLRFRSLGLTSGHRTNPGIELTLSHHRPPPNPEQQHTTPELHSM